MARVDNPFAFRAYDHNMKAENAANYTTPDKRAKIKDYLSKSSLNYTSGPSTLSKTFVFAKFSFR